jgi:hypothetical protein
MMPNSLSKARSALDVTAKPVVGAPVKPRNNNSSKASFQPNRLNKVSGARK